MASTAKQLEWQAGWNMKEQQLAYELNKQALDYQNAYNQPNAQLARLRAAGLNPLYYGLDGNSSNGAPFQTQPMENSVSQAQQAAQAEQANFNNAIANTLTAAKTMAEVRQMDAQTELTKQQIPQIQSETALNRYELTWRPVKNGMELRVGESTIKVNSSEAEKNSQSARVLENEANRNQYIINEIASRIRANDASAAESYASVAVQNSLVDLNAAQSKYWNQKTQTENANTGIAFEQWAQEQIKTGALPEQFRLDFGLKGKDFKLKDAQILNLQKLSDVYKEQAGKIHEDLIIDGVKVGIWKNENGQLVYDYAKVVSQSTARNIEHTLGVYLKMYEDFKNTQSNSINATANLVGSVIPGFKLSLGQKNGVTATKSPSWATEVYY